MNNAGLVSVAAYMPAKPVPHGLASRLAAFLAERTLLCPEYIAPIAEQHVLPGTIESNYDGWEKQPWFEAWRRTLPEKRREDPFLGMRERRRVPLDPRSVRDCIHPHPMLSTDAEALAGAIALVQAGIDPGEVDLVLVHSQMPDSLPPMAAAVQHVLQLPNAGAYGIDSCCSSFITMNEIAASLVRCGIKKCVLIVGSHIASHVMDRSESCCVRLGDGAVAGVVAPVNHGNGYVCSSSTADGSVHDAVLMVQRPPTLQRGTFLGPSHAQHMVTFFNAAACKEIARKSHDEMLRMTSMLFERAGVNASDVDFFVTHQPVEWAGNAWREALGIPPDRFHESYDRYGNVGTCCCAINLAEAIELGRIQPGDLVLIASSGAGENHIGLLERASERLVQSSRPC